GQGTLSDPYMRVRDSSGTSLALDDDSGTGTDARISGFVASYGGTYYVSAGSALSSGDTGTYILRAAQTALSATPSISSASPSSYPADSLNHTMQVFGSNFANGDTLTFIPPEGGTIASNAVKLTFVSSSE